MKAVDCYLRAFCIQDESKKTIHFYKNYILKVFARLSLLQTKIIMTFSLLHKELYYIFSKKCNPLCPYHNSEMDFKSGL